MRILLSDLIWLPEAGLSVFGTHDKLNEYVMNLKSDIEKNGVHKPPTVRPSNETELNTWHKPYRVLQGNHRCQAVQELGWADIECEVKHGR